MNADVSIEGSFSGYQRDRVFYNPDGSGADAQRFFETGWLFGLDDDHDGRCLVPLDVDGDGDLDLAALTLQGLRLYENRAAPARFTRLRLVATSGARSALGAVVRVTAGGVTQSDHAKVTDGFQSQVPTDLHFGLGALEQVERVRVAWPSGLVQDWTGLPADRLVVLTEGRAEAELTELPRWPQVPAARRAAEPARALAAWADDDDDDGGDADARRVQVVHWLEAPAPGAPPAVPPELAAASRAFGDARWILVAPAALDDAPLERARAALPAGFRIVRAAAEQVEQCFGPGEPPVRPATFVFQDGRLCQSFYRRVQPAELEGLLRSLEDEPPFPELLVWTARRALDAGRLDEALALFEQASGIDPRLATAFEGMGRCHVALGALERAEEAYARAVRADPDYGLGHFNLAVTRAQLGRYADALDPFREALRVQGDEAPVLLAFGEAAALAGQPQVALEAFERAARADPESAAAHLLQGKVLGQLGRYEEALACFERCLALEPENADARRALELARRIVSEG